jgi:hypothetical protein
MIGKAFYKTALLAVIIATIFIMRCSNLSGGGSEAGNARIIGRVLDIHGSPVSNALVTAQSSDFDPVKRTAFPGSYIGTTGTDGMFVLVVQKGRMYTIQAVHTTVRTRALIADIAVGDTDVSTPQCTLNIPGAITVTLPDSADKTLGYVYVPGTSILTFLNNAPGVVVLDSVPAGVIPEIAYSSTSSPVSNVIRHLIRVHPGDTAAIYNPSWKYARQLFLNTTTTGAQVTGTILNFPVLVRLDNSNFGFDQTHPDGVDLRFSKSNGSPLPYEIERWDPVTGHAEVWVKVDTIFGNDSSQFITMYWGNLIATGASSSATVFDTAAGFAGVWHMGQTTGSMVPDATVNGNNGTATATTSAEGAVGMAQMFNGSSSLVQATGPASDKLNFPENGTFTVSAWVKANALDSLFHGIVYKSNFQYGLQLKPENKWEFLNYIDQTRWEMSRSPAAANSWHAVTGVRNGTKQYLYVDGECADSTIVNVVMKFARAYDQPLEIGHCPDGGANPDRFFNGLIDEVRVENINRNADWIKLCYMNQKEQDALVTW